MGRLFRNRPSHMQRFLIILPLVLIFALGIGLAGLSPARMSSLAPAQQATPTGDASEEQLPPVLIATTPDQDATWVDGPITLTFDQPLDPGAAEYATIAPDLAGDFSIAGAELIFTPSAPAEPGMVYTVRLDAAASSASGVTLGAAVEATFSAATPLLVTATQPGDGAAEVSTDSQLLIVFNRPVVALSGVDDQADLPDPLSITPAVEGEGRWLSTSIYAFQPATAFAGATQYTVVVDNISDLDGIALDQPYEFEFTTAAPIVDSSLPTGSLVRPDATVTVQFTQPMDPASTEAAFSLSTSASGTPVEGEINWQNRFTTLTFTPSEPLQFGATYIIGVAETAQPASQQGTLRSAYSRTFTVVPRPAVEATSPTQGAQEVSPDASIIVRFNAPVSPTLVIENISVSPMLTTTQVFSYYSEYLNELQISWFKEPNTTYTVTIGADIADEYGNRLGEDYLLTFTTGDYDPFVTLEAERFTHFTAYSDTRLSLLYRNIAELDVTLYHLPEDELFKLTGVNQWEVWQNYQLPNPEANQIWSRSYEVTEERNVSIRQVITLTDEAGNQLAPGVYFVEVAKPGGDALDDPNAASQAVDTAVNTNYVSQALVVISNLNLTLKRSESATSMVWLTDLRTGEPVGGVPVRFFNQGALVDEGETEDDGTLMAEIRPDPEFSWAPVLAIAGEPGDENFAVVSSEWSSGIAIWEFNLPGGWSLDNLQSYFYTDRPVYRPGQTVYWKGIVRALVGDNYQLPPPDLTIQVALRDPMGNALLEDEFTLSEIGTIHGEVHLSEEALTGSYYMEVRLPLGGERIAYGGTGFMVASYRPPEFEISLEPEETEYQQGETVRVTLQANYFSGGALANSPVTWRLFSDPYTFLWEEGPEDRYYSFQPFDPDQAVYDPYSGSFNFGLLREGVGTTGPDGSFVIELPADIGVSPQSQLWSFDVTVQSPNNQFVSARTSVPVHKADFYIGVSPREYVGVIDQATTIDFVTVTPEGEPYPEADVDVVIYEYQWNSVYGRAADGVYRWQTSVNRNPVYSTTITTDDEGMAALEWTPRLGGQYQIAALGTDENGNTTSSNGFIWISVPDPDEFVAWPRGNNDRIELVADKRLYAPGGTASILIPSPFTGPVNALVTVERAGIVSAEVITLEGNSETLELPINEDLIPNVFVSVMIVKGIDETNPTPAMRVGYVQLNVDTAAKELILDVESSGARTEPGTTVAYTMTVTDQAGEPVPDTEVSVALVDRAVLSLAFVQESDLVDIFYYQRPLGILTSALLTINQDRMSAQLSEGAKGGGGGGDAGIDVRSEFPDIAYWRADLVSDARGVITFSVNLPDNLTTWRLVAKAVTEDTRVGNATYDVVATKDLQVRPLLPRFFTAGDQATIGATLINATTDDVGDGTMSIEMSGASFVDDPETTIEFNLTAGEQIRNDWEIAVDPLSTQVIFTFTASAEVDGASGELTDAVRLVVPVNQFVARETVATSGQVQAAGVLEGIRVPDAATEDGELQVTIEPSLAAGMLSGLSYLRDYPYESTEQTVSSFLPNLFTARAATEAGINDEQLLAGLEAQVNSGIQRLVNRQSQDGGWGYWPGERSSVFITAYALWGLATADEMGYTVPQRTLRNAIDFIERSFVAPDRIESSWQLNEISFMLYVLSEIGEGDPGRTSTLYDVRERLGDYGKAFLAMTLANLQVSGTRDSRIDTLLDDLYRAANVTGATAWWQEESIDFRNLNTNTRTTAIVLAAFIRLDPEQPLLPSVVRWLMEMREAEGHWSSTQETAWALIALSDWLELTSETQPDYTWSVTLNDEELGSGTVAPENATDIVTLRAALVELVRDEVNALRFNRSSNQGRMYYTTYLRYTLDAAQVEARDRGVALERHFALADGAADQHIERAAVGDVISVTVTIVAPTDLHHLMVEVPIPAGTEPIDPSLATTSDVFMDPMMTQTGEEQLEGPTWWHYWIPSYTDLRDDRVTVFATFLEAGTYEYTFTVRASVPGEYSVLPAYGEQVYFPEVWGRSAGAAFTVEE